MANVCCLSCAGNSMVFAIDVAALDRELLCEYYHPVFDVPRDAPRNLIEFEGIVQWRMYVA